MTQDQVIILLLKIFLIAGIISISSFIIEYTWRAPWWRNQIGRTLIVKDFLLIMVFIPTTLSLFFQFSRLSSHVAAWLQVAMIGLVTPVMIWRILVWEKLHRDTPAETHARHRREPGRGDAGIPGDDPEEAQP